MKECNECKIKAKMIINIIYFALVVVVLEMANKLIPHFNQLTTISSGSPLDLLANTVSTIAIYVVLIVVAFSLIANFKNFKKDMVKKGSSRCSVFNPFC